MIGDLLTVPSALGAFGLALLIFGFAPGMVLALIVRLLPGDDPRRSELQAELYAVPRRERPLWVAEQFEVALREGLGVRISWWFGRRVLHPATIESGLQQHRAHPDTFDVPCDEDKQLLRPGDSIKLMWSVKRSQPSGERMWVTVTHRDGNKLVGVLDNWAMVAYLEPGETVKFHVDDIIDCVFDDDDDDDDEDAVA